MMKSSMYWFSGIVFHEAVCRKDSVDGNLLGLGGW